jgi:3-hydroxymyristoyl/3-hydroxydecanoyl-(acyl carrier protein) dehydratase
MCFLFVDRIVNLTPGKSIQGIKHITWDDLYLVHDQNGQISFAPSLIGETLGQLAAWNVMAYYDFKYRPVAGIVASTRLLRQVYPGETLLLESVIDDLDESAVRYHSVAKVGQEPVFIIDGAIGPLLPMDTFIESTTIRQQFAEINRPGNWQQYLEQAPVPEQASGLNSVDVNVMTQPVNPVTTQAMRFDQVSIIEPNNYWMAKKLVSRSASYFADHFPLNPVLPMTVLLQCQLNLADQWIRAAGLQTHYQLTQLRKIKMNEFVHPGDVLITHLKLKNKNIDELILSCLSEVNGKRVCIVEICYEKIN